MSALVINFNYKLQIGILAGLNDTDPFQPGTKFFLFVGLLGGYTTFSSFSIETINLFRNAMPGYALLNIFISNTAGLLLAFSGFYLSKMAIRFVK